MLDKLTYKQKTIVVIFLGLLLFITGYQLAIRPTIDLHFKIEQSRNAIQTAKAAPFNIERYQIELKKLNQKVGKTATSFEVFQKEVLNTIVPFTEKKGMKIEVIHLPHFAQEKKFEIQTLQIECQSSFKNLTLLLDHIQKQNIGRVCSVDYEMKKNNLLKKWFLFSTIYIQNYKAL